MTMDWTWHVFWGEKLDNIKKNNNYTYHHEQVRLQNGSLNLVIYPIVICNAEKNEGEKKINIVYIKVPS